MRRQELAQILLSPQFAHDLGDGQFRKNTLSLQTQRQEIGEHFDQQCGVQTIVLSLHRADMEYRFQNLPETLNHMMLLPDVPDFCTTQRYLTKMHQIIAARCAFAKKEQNERPKSRTVTPGATRWHVNAPCGLFQHQDFFPC
jgi:hypothetical protein